MNNFAALNKLAAFNQLAQCLNLATILSDPCEKETSIGLAAPLSATVQNQTEDIYRI